MCVYLTLWLCRSLSLCLFCWILDVFCFSSLPVLFISSFFFRNYVSNRVFFIFGRHVLVVSCLSISHLFQCNYLPDIWLAKWTILPFVIQLNPLYVVVSHLFSSIKLNTQTSSLLINLISVSLFLLWISYIQRYSTTCQIKKPRFYSPVHWRFSRFFSFFLTLRTCSKVAAFNESLCNVSILSCFCLSSYFYYFYSSLQYFYFYFI